MALKPNDPNIQASLLDRLVDREPKEVREPVQYRFLSVAQAKEAIVRDLENLLNTRRQIFPPPLEYRQLRDSLFVYGLRDFSLENPQSPFVKQRLRQEIERLIARFEPRLKNVAVQIETAGKTGRNLRFRITALLVVEPVTEPVIFDTYYDGSRGEYRITR